MVGFDPRTSHASVKYVTLTPLPPAKYIRVQINDTVHFTINLEL